MKAWNRNILLVAIFIFAGVASGYVFSERRSSAGSEIEKDFFIRHKRQSVIISKLSVELNPLIGRMNFYANDSFNICPKDSMHVLLYKSLQTLIECNNGLHEINDLNKYDSLGIRNGDKQKRN